MKDRNKIFTERLKQVRVERGLTMPQLGQIISVKKQSINSLEKGTSRPSFEVFCDLAEALDVSLDYLVGRTDEREDI